MHEYKVQITFFSLRRGYSHNLVKFFIIIIPAELNALLIQEISCIYQHLTESNNLQGKNKRM
jgi:hypothetical protein